MSPDKAALVDLIQEEIYFATPLPKIVRKAVKKAGIDLGEHSDDTEMFENWLDFAKKSRLRRRNTLKNPDLLTDDVHFILSTIYEQLENAKRGIEARTCDYRGCKFRMLSERYAIDGRHDKKGDLKSFILHDCVHGQSTDLKMDEKISKISHNFYNLHSVDEEHFFFVPQVKYEKNEGSPAYTMKKDYSIHLVRVHFDELRCEILDSKFAEVPDNDDTHYVDNRIDYVVKDRKNQRRFLLHGIFNQNWGCRFVEIVQGKMIFGDVFSDRTSDIYIRHWILEGNDIYVLCRTIEKIDEKPHFVFKKIVVGADPKEQSTFCTIENPFDEDVNMLLGIENFYCSEKHVYEWGLSFASDVSILRFDLEKRTVHKIDVDDNVRSYHTCLIEKDNVLTMCSPESTSSQYLTKRFQFGIPDKLQQLSMAAIQKRAFFSDQEKYDQLCEQLPVKWRPFGDVVHELMEIKSQDTITYRHKDPWSKKRKSPASGAGRTKRSRN